MKTNTSRIITLLCAVLNCLPLSAATTKNINATTLNSNSIYQSKSKWETQAGVKSKLLTLRGKPVVVAMVYTSCQGTCPLMMNDLKTIEKGLSSDDKEKIQFAVFAFDSENDRPKQLRAFAKKHEVNLDHWTFFHGASASVRELAALLNVKFKELDGGGFDHSNVITILDAEGVIVHQQIGLRQNPEDSIKALKKAIESK